MFLRHSLMLRPPLGWTRFVTITTNDLRALLSYYKITDQGVVDYLVETARKSRERSAWWAEFKDIATPELLVMCGYESSARVIRNFEPLLVPGLLQTEEYAASVYEKVRGSKDPRRLEGLVKLRLQRQEMLNADGQYSPSLHFIMDEAAIHRVVGGPAVMRKQLRRLKELAERPNVTIRVVPFTHGMYRGLRVPYVVFEYDDPQDETILYLENPQGETVISEQNAPPSDEDEGVATPAIYLEMFWELEQAASMEDTQIILDRAISGLSAPSMSTLDLRATREPVRNVADGATTGDPGDDGPRPIE